MFFLHNKFAPVSHPRTLCLGQKFLYLRVFGQPMFLGNSDDDSSAPLLWRHVPLGSQNMRDCLPVLRRQQTDTDRIVGSLSTPKIYPWWNSGRQVHDYVVDIAISICGCCDLCPEVCSGASRCDLQCRGEAGAALQGGGQVRPGCAVHLYSTTVWYVGTVHLYITSDHISDWSW